MINDFTSRLLQLRDANKTYADGSRRLLLDALKEFHKKYRKNKVFFPRYNCPPEGHASDSYHDYDVEVVLISISFRMSGGEVTFVNAHMQERDMGEDVLADICDKGHTYTHSDIDLCDIAEEVLSQIDSGICEDPFE